jgi:hypothetical protein
MGIITKIVNYMYMQMYASDIACTYTLRAPHVRLLYYNVYIYICTLG